MVREKNPSNQYGSPIACQSEHARVIECVEHARDKDFALVHLWCVRQLDDLSHCVHTTQRSAQEVEHGTGWRELPPRGIPFRRGPHDDMRLQDVMLATQAEEDKHQARTIPIPITVAATSSVTHKTEGMQGSQLEHAPPPRLWSSSFRTEARTIDADDSERVSRRPIFNIPPPPPLYRAKGNSGVTATEQSGDQSLGDDDTNDDTTKPSERGFFRFLPWMTKKEDAELYDMMRSALNEATSAAVALSKSAIPDVPMDQSAREQDKNPMDWHAHLTSSNQDGEGTKSHWNCNRTIRSPFCPLYWFQKAGEHENDSSGLDQDSDPSPSLVSSYHRERDHARSAHYHQDSRKDRLPIYRSQWIDDEQPPKANENANDTTTRTWVDQMLGTCNAMSQGKSEQDRLNRFAIAYERVQANDPMNQTTTSNKLYHDNVGMLQAFQFCLALENLGKQLPAATAAGSRK